MAWLSLIEPVVLGVAKTKSASTPLALMVPVFKDNADVEKYSKPALVSPD